MWNTLLRPKIIYSAIGAVLLAIVIISTLLFLKSNSQTAQTTENADHVENELIVSFSKPQNIQTLQNELSNFKITSLEEISDNSEKNSSYVYRIVFEKDTDLKKAQEELNKLQNVNHADPNLIFRTLNDE